MPDPNSRPVLLVHGFTTSAERTWREPGWIDLLADAGRSVIAPDLLGHGRAPKPHDVEAYAAVEDLVAAELPDGRPVDAVGYSAGAAVVLSLAAEAPERFGRVVLAGVGRNLLEERGENPILDALEGRGDPDDLVGQHFRSLAEADGNDPQALIAFAKRRRPELTAEVLAGVAVPALVILGDRDFAGPGDPLVEALPDAELVTLPRIDHFGLPKAFPFLERALRFIGADPLG